jgi:hypothetical protein
MVKLMFLLSWDWLVLLLMMMVEMVMMAGLMQAIIITIIDALYNKISSCVPFPSTPPLNMM